jgi:hypothetical protein
VAQQSDDLYLAIDLACDRAGRTAGRRTGRNVARRRDATDQPFEQDTIEN